CVHWAEAGTPLDFGHELLPDALGRIDENLADAIEVLPVIGTAGVKRVINGPMIFSPDLAPLLGPYPGKRNYVCAAGVMTGFNQGGGIGKVIAEWIIDGEPSLDVTPWDVARFGGWAGRAYTKARSGYFYEHRSHRTYPGQQFEAGRPVRTTPIHAELTKRGAVWGESFGLEVPLWYARPGDEQRDRYAYGRQNWFDAVVEEARAVADRVGLFEIASFSKFMLSGSDARAWLDRLLAGTIPVAGRTALSPMLSPKGRLIGDFTVSATDDGRFVLIGSGAAQRIHERWFDLNLTGGEDVRIENRSCDWAGLHIAGPHSRELLSRVAAAPLDNTAFPFMANRRMDLDGCPESMVVRVSFTGELGYEFHFPQQYEQAFLSRLIEAGSDLGLRLAGSRALMWLRLEKAYPSWGLELSPDYSPAQPGLDRFVCWDKDFVGRDAAAAQRIDPRERLVTLVVQADGADCWGGESVFRGDEHVGYVTSGGFGPRLGESLALGYLRTVAIEDGAEVTVLVKGDPHPATVRTAPRYDPQGKRLRA
ncbi:MAG: FAD-dependent oxidoreductase, partial [Rhizobiaceae bacterium]|nr:FAD-dependent oxidoreductase [Rhizobiaceae bacterium]